MDIRKAFTFDNEQVRVRVNAAVEAALQDWLSDHRSELEDLLRPYGLGPMDVAAPRFYRIVAEEEARARLGVQ